MIQWNLSVTTTNLLLLTISAFWSSSRWPLTTWMSSRMLRSIPLCGRYRQVSLHGTLRHDSICSSTKICSMNSWRVFCVKNTIYLNILWFINIKMALAPEIISLGRERPFFLHYHFYSCWWTCVYVMAWCVKEAKPCPEPTMTEFGNALCYG